MKLIKQTALVIGSIVTLGLTGCSDVTIASSNLSKAADNFELDRRIVFYNGITGEYMLTIQGRCSVSYNDKRLAVTCKTLRNGYKKHYLGLSDNVTWFSEQLNDKDVNVDHYRVVFKPQSILPDVDFRGGVDTLQKSVTPDNND